MVYCASNSNNLNDCETTAYNNYILTSNKKYYEEDMIWKKQVALQERLAWFNKLQILIQEYAHYIYIMLHNRIYSDMPFITRRTVKSTQPPGQRSIHGGRRK